MSTKLQQSVSETGSTEAEYLRLALAMQGIAAAEEVCDRVIETYKKLNTLGGSFSVKDAVDLKVKMDYKYAEKIAIEAKKKEETKQ